MQNRNELAKAEGVERDDVARILCLNGWEPLDAWDDITIYRRPAEEDSFGEVVLPKKKDDPLYASYMVSAAHALSEYEGTDPLAVLTRWRRARFDRVRFRLVSDVVQDGAAPLACLQSLVIGSTGALKTAVKDVESPCRYHRLVYSSSIGELARRAEFGQTEEGSFVINVFLPLGTADEETTFEETQGRVYRRALEHLVTTSASAVRYAESDDPGGFLNAPENRVTSANLLEALLTARDYEDADLEISVDWSPLSAPSRGVPNRAYLSKEHARLLRGWARAWKPEETEETRQFVGKVAELRGYDRDASDKPFGEVVLSIFDDETNYKATATLNVVDYRVAYEAYYENAPVTFQGRVNRKGATARFLEAFNMRRVDV